MSTRISLIVAVGERTGVIGRENTLPWNLERGNPDMKRFAGLTGGHPAIMGHKTMKSFPPEFFPLSRGRTGIVLSRTLNDGDMPANTHLARDFDEAIGRAMESPGNDEIFVWGGAEIYSLALPYADRIYKTVVHLDVEGDTFFPEHPDIGKIVDAYTPDFEPPLTFLTIDRE